MYVPDFSPGRPSPGGAEGAGVGQAGAVGRGRRLGSGAGPVGRGRPELPARVRAHHAREGAPGPIQAGRRRRLGARALDLLRRLLRAAEEGQRTGSVIEILVLQALAHQLAGDIPAALGPLERALALAEPEGYVRMFVDEGPPMAALLAGGGQARGRPDIRSATCWRRSVGLRPACASTRTWSSR